MGAGRKCGVLKIEPNFQPNFEPWNHLLRISIFLCELFFLLLPFLLLPFLLLPFLLLRLLALSAGQKHIFSLGVGFDLRTRLPRQLDGSVLLRRLHRRLHLLRVTMAANLIAQDELWGKIG